MATDVGVQFFSHLNGLTLGNNWGDLIRLLDKCLVNGLPLTSITSASIDTQGDITLNLYAAHNCMLFQIVELAGFTPSELNGKYRIKGTPTATQLILKATHTGKIITAAGTAKLASLGYDIIFRDIDDVKRVYRAKNPTAQHPFIRVDETISDGTNSYSSAYAKSAMVGLVANMTHIDDYETSQVLQLPFDPINPKRNWSISGSGASSVRGWSKWYWACSQSLPNGPFDFDGAPTGNRSFTIIGDKDAFYFIRALIGESPQDKLISGCGLFNSALDSSIVPNWFLMATEKTTNAGSTSGGFSFIGGGLPLVFDNNGCTFFVTAYDVINPIKADVQATPLLPDYFTGRSSIYSGTSIAALEIAFADSNKCLRGNLKYIAYSGNNRSSIQNTTPLASDGTMYVYESLWTNSGNGGVYFYLGELE